MRIASTSSDIVPSIYPLAVAAAFVPTLPPLLPVAVEDSVASEPGEAAGVVLAHSAVELEAVVATELVDSAGLPQPIVAVEHVGLAQVELVACFAFVVHSSDSAGLDSLLALELVPGVA